MVTDRRQTFFSHTEEQTEQLGHELALSLSPGTLVTLDGGLGSGKTALAAAIAEGIGVDRREIQSPTYVIMRSYRSGNIPIYHWDFYRIASSDELLTADFLEILSERSSLVLVEWASLFPTVWRSFFPRIEIDITLGEEHATRIISYIHKG
ncbi:MAG TPA: tRNA (adenosine(37)-N6)-threonylcarbamoyltransferase complex ATPase subunit type 1 TsaE [bacterium]|nr:tRNA (adenosine(37)-N6)-threonylcarbamoyltransferase complex ATPase subunit type 1 TsaE [bacterium]